MFHHKKILSIIPARGGSKGIPLKNLRKVRNKSLVRRAIETCQDVHFIDRIIVSTDNQLIAEEAIKCGIEVPFFRPENLSGDYISDLEVLQHGLIEAEKYWQLKFDIVLMVQPTAPLRHPSDIVECLSYLANERYDAVWTISEVDLKYHPLKQLTLFDEQLNFFDNEGHRIIARQQLKPTYYRNGCCYAFRRSVLMEKNTILPEKTRGIIIKRPLVSIDTEEDLIFAESILKETN